MTNVLGPVIALEHLGGAKAWGIVSGAEGVGFVLGSLITLRIKPNRPLVVGNALLVLSAVPCVLLAKPTSTWLIAASVIPAMAGLGILNALWSTVIGLRLPEHVLSRVNSFDWIISLVVNPAGLALAGPLSVAIGTRSTLLIAAATIAVPSTLICFVPSVRSVTAA